MDPGGGGKTCHAMFDIGSWDCAKPAGKRFGLKGCHQTDSFLPPNRARQRILKDDQPVAKSHVSISNLELGFWSVATASLLMHPAASTKRLGAERCDPWSQHAAVCHRKML